MLKALGKETSNLHKLGDIRYKVSCRNYNKRNKWKKQRRINGGK